MAFQNRQMMNQPQNSYSFHVSCPYKHLGYIIGKSGKVRNGLIQKWNGKIKDIVVNQPCPEKGRPTHYFTIIGEEKAVHLLCLEINEMIKVSMLRLETRYQCEMNKVDTYVATEQRNKLKIELLEQEIWELSNYKIE